MSFSIELANSQASISSEIDVGVGVIKIGSFQEHFMATLTYWEIDDYFNHWKVAIERVTQSTLASCLITSMVDPVTSSHIFWWPMYRENDTVIFQNHILFFDKLKSPFDERNPFLTVPERQTVDEDGNNISEWTVHISELMEFLIKSNGVRRPIPKIS